MALVALVVTTTADRAVAGAQASLTATRVPSPPPAPYPPASPNLGAVVTTNSPGWATLLDRSDTAGALVMGVVPASPAASAGIRRGDVILAIDDAKIHSGEDVETRLKARLSRSRLVTLVAPGGGARTTAVNLDGVAPVDLLDHLARAMVNDPDPVTRFLYAEHVESAGASLAALDALVADVPQFAEAHVQRAFLLAQVAAQVRASGGTERMSEAAQAEEAVARALELDPNSLEVRAVAARVFGLLGDPARARSHAEVAVGLVATSAAAHNLLGGALLALGEADDGLAHLRRAVALSPHFGPYYSSLARGYERVGATEEAEKTLDALMALGGSTEKGTGVAGRALRLLLAAAALVAVMVGLVGGARRLRAWRAGGAQPDWQAPSLLAPLGLAEVLAVLGGWTVAIPYMGAAFGLAPAPDGTVELFDHVIPGVIVAVMGVLAAHRLLERQAGDSGILQWAPVAAGIAGLWVARMHVPFVQVARHGELPWSLVAFHASTVVPIVAVSFLLNRAVRTPSAGPDLAAPTQGSVMAPGPE